MFSCVWCISKYFSKNIFWCLEKKLEKKKEEAKPRKTWTNPEEHGVILRSTVRSRIAIDGAISDCNWRRDLAKRRSRSARPVLREIAIDGAISRSVDRDRREWCFAQDRAAQSCVLSLSRSPFARALFACPQFRKSFEVKIGTKMNFCGQRYYFTVNWKWFSENSIFQTNQIAYFTENDFLKPFSPKTNPALDAVP